MTTAEKILAVADMRRLDLRRLSEACGIPFHTLKSYAKLGSTRVPTATKGVALAKALDVPTDWLFDDSQGMPPPPRLASPPFPLHPWPPKLFSWGEVQMALARHLVERYRKAIEKRKGLLDPQDPMRDDPEKLAFHFYCEGGELDDMLVELARILDGRHHFAAEVRQWLFNECEFYWAAEELRVAKIASGEWLGPNIWKPDKAPP